MDRSELKKVDATFWQNSSITFLPIHLYDALENMNSELEKIDELLVDDDVESINHTSYLDDAEYTCEMLGKMLAYSSDLATYASYLIDEPLYKNFNLHATEDISRIKVEDYTTPNTIGVQIAYVHADESEHIDTPETLSIEDFLGITSPENGGRLRNVPKEFTDFTEQYVKIYETLKDSLVDEKGNQISLKDYLKELESLGEFSHTKDQPFKQFLSALLDITIVVPFIEMCTGEDFITDEDLSDFERGMKGVSVVLGIFTLGQSGILEMPFKEGLMSLGKFAAVDAASTTASYWTGYACNEMGLPLPLTILLSTAMGMGVSSGMSKIINNHIIFEDSVTYKVDDSDFEKNLKRILKENNMTLDDFDRMKLTNQSELTHYEKHVMRQIRESIPMPDSNTLMQKAIPIGDVEKYMDGTYKQVGGYVSRAQDVVSLNSYDEIYESLRLDYPNTAYQVDTDEYMAVIRFKTDDVSLMDIPYGHEFGGDVTASQPFTGNGFLKSTNGRVIPEYKCGRMNMQEGAEIIRIGKDGSQKLLGVYSEAAQEFIPVN